MSTSRIENVTAWGTGPGRHSFSESIADARKRESIADARKRESPVSYKGASIEQELDGSFSVYRAGDPYATTTGFKTTEAAKKAIDG